jgi:DNA-binding NtrC family response regulator
VGDPGGKPTARYVRIVSVAMVSRKKVLVIEDERPIAEPLADALRREGFDVHLAETAADGLEAFSAQAPTSFSSTSCCPTATGATCSAKSARHRARRS